jgi:hypothetical protein
MHILARGIRHFPSWLTVHAYFGPAGSSLFAHAARAKRGLVIISWEPSENQLLLLHRRALFFLFVLFLRHLGFVIFPAWAWRRRYTLE